MTIVLIVVALLALAAAVVRQGAPPARPRPASAEPSRPDAVERPTEIALRDPVEALLRYGTEADAARLADQGTDLAALGYRPQPD